MKRLAAGVEPASTAVKMRRRIFLSPSGVGRIFRPAREADASVVRRLLAYAIGSPTEDRLEQVSSAYESNPELKIYVLDEGGSITGVVGARIRCADRAEVLHIAVDPPARRRGAGAYLIQELIRNESLAEIEAETDGEAVGFYQKCGFAVESLGEKFPRAERFRCRWVCPAR